MPSSSKMVVPVLSGHGRGRQPQPKPSLQRGGVGRTHPAPCLLASNFRASPVLSLSGNLEERVPKGCVPVSKLCPPQQDGKVQRAVSADQVERVQHKWNINSATVVKQLTRSRCCVTLFPRSTCLIHSTAYSVGIIASTF